MLNRFLSLFLKPNCPLCQRPADELFCEYCLDKLSSCELNHQYQKFITPDFFLFSWGKYDSELKRAIASLKYNQQPEIGHILGEWLGKAWLKLGNKNQYPQLIIIPIPSHPQRRKTRGYNQAELIARGFCKITGYQLKTHLLIREKDTEAMFGLNLAQRKENIHQAFKIGIDYPQISPGQNILIIDDIYTSGTTVNEAQQVLQKANLKTIGVATASRVN